MRCGFKESPVIICKAILWCRGVATSDIKYIESFTKENVFLYLAAVLKSHEPNGPIM